MSKDVESILILARELSSLPLSQDTRKTLIQIALKGRPNLVLRGEPDLCYEVAIMMGRASCELSVIKTNDLLPGSIREICEIAERDDAVPFSFAMKSERLNKVGIQRELEAALNQQPHRLRFLVIDTGTCPLPDALLRHFEKISLHQ